MDSKLKHHRSGITHLVSSEVMKPNNSKRFCKSIWFMLKVIRPLNNTVFEYQGILSLTSLGWDNPATDQFACSNVTEPLARILYTGDLEQSHCCTCTDSREDIGPNKPVHPEHLTLSTINCKLFTSYCTLFTIHRAYAMMQSDASCCLSYLSSVTAWVVRQIFGQNKKVILGLYASVNLYIGQPLLSWLWHHYINTTVCCQKSQPSLSFTALHIQHSLNLLCQKSKAHHMCITMGFSHKTRLQRQ